MMNILQKKSSRRKRPVNADQKIFVDTSAWLAVADRSETRHKIAVMTYEKLLSGSTLLTTSDLILAETHILINRRLHPLAARTFLESVNTSPSIEILFLDEAIESTCKEILKKYEDQDFSFADAASFALMHANQIKTAFAFDTDFVIAGFQIVPE